MLKEIFAKKSEMIMFTAGFLILLSVASVYFTGNFTFWWSAKALYAVGVILIIFKK